MAMSCCFNHCNTSEQGYIQAEVFILMKQWVSKLSKSVTATFPHTYIQEKTQQQGTRLQTIGLIQLS